MLFKNIKLIDESFKARGDMFVRTEGAVITYIGEKCPEELKGEEIYDGRGKVMLPGLYNMHCHVPMTILRGYGDGLPLQKWLFEKIFPFEARLTGKDVFWSTQLGAMELIAGGSVSISDMYFFIDDMARALYESGMKANICHGISSMDNKAVFKDMKGYRDTIALAEAVRAGAYRTEGGGEDSRILADMGLHAEYTTTEGFVRQAAEAASECGMTVHVHVSETKSEHEECKQRHGGKTPVQYFSDCGILKNRTLAAHCVYLEEEDVELMKAAGAVAVHNPSSNLKLGSGIAPVKAFLNKGLNVALGTDGASSNNNLNMMEEMHMAAMLSRGASGDANAISASDILKMASYEGAKAQGRALCGKLCEGWRADIVIVDTDRPHMQPDFDTVSNLVFSAQSSDIVLSMIDGRVVYKNGEYTYIDRERVIFEANRSFRRILGEL
ncbi:MAG: amidohydrolase [Clostridiales bacterium]|nr:amidohydrolase [Clostridiales bacterium]